MTTRRSVAADIDAAREKQPELPSLVPHVIAAQQVLDLWVRDEEGIVWNPFAWYRSVKNKAISATKLFVPRSHGGFRYDAVPARLRPKGLTSLYLPREQDKIANLGDICLTFHCALEPEAIKRHARQTYALEPESALGATVFRYNGVPAATIPPGSDYRLILHTRQIEETHYLPGAIIGLADDVFGGSVTLEDLTPEFAPRAAALGVSMAQQSLLQLQQDAPERGMETLRRMRAAARMPARSAMQRFGERERRDLSQDLRQATTPEAMGAIGVSIGVEGLYSPRSRSF